MLGGCATASPVTERPGEYCALYAPIRSPRSLAIADPETDAQIQANNARWLCVCEGDCGDAP